MTNIHPIIANVIARHIPFIGDKFDAFDPDNFDEAMGEASPAMKKVLADALAKQDYLLYGEISYSLTVDYWKKRKEEHEVAEIEKSRFWDGSRTYRGEI